MKIVTMRMNLLMALSSVIETLIDTDLASTVSPESNVIHTVMFISDSITVNASIVKLVITSSNEIE